MEQKTATPAWATLAGSAAVVTGVGAFLYYLGYLFLRGYYGWFGIPVEMLGLTAEQILAESGTILVPNLLIYLVTAIIIIATSRSHNVGVMQQIRAWRYPVTLVGAVYMLVLLFLTPATGRWFADKQIHGQFSAYGPLANPIPSVVLYTKEPLPLPLREARSGGAMHRYEGLRLVATSEDYLFVTTGEAAAFAVPREAALAVRFTD